MALFAVIADDLTGANATGVLLTKRGLPAVTVFRPGPVPSDREVMSWSTDSRAVQPDEAYKRVSEAAHALLDQGARNFAKRIDSTVRGNLGPEVDAVLDVLGQDSFAAVTPAFPASGRAVAGGYLLVNGVPVSETAAAHDVATPVHISHVPTLMAAQTKYEVGVIPLEVVLAGPAEVKRAALTELTEHRARVLVVDATTDAHLSTLARGLEMVGRPYFPADPGPFTSAVFAERAGERPTAGIPAHPKPQGPVLLVAGSVTPLTFEQISHVRGHLETVMVKLSAEHDEDLASLVEILTNAVKDTTRVAMLCTAESAEDVREKVSPADLSAIAGKLGQAARMALGSRRWSGMVTTGGDVTLGVCSALGAHGIALEREVLPLASEGMLLGGQAEGTTIVTKGGLVGDETALYRCCLSVLEGD